MTGPTREFASSDAVAGTAGSGIGPGAPSVDIAVDNDIVIKSLRYGITEALIPASTYPKRGVLEVAKHVVPRIVRRKHRRSDPEVENDITALFATWTLLNPTEIGRAV